MKLPLASIFLMSVLLVGAVAPALNGYQMLDGILPKAFVENAFAQTDDNDTEDTDETDTEDAEDDDLTVNLGQQVSTFVHDAKDQFQAQKEETKAIIKQCRVLLEAATPETRTDIKKQCREDLNEVKESYKQLRRTYHDVFKEFRTHVRAILQDPDNASTIRALNSLPEQEQLKDRIHELRMQMKEELRTEIKDLREQMKTERETMRKEIKNMIDEGVDREKIKEELKSVREQMKKEQEKVKEQIKQEREKMKEEREKVKEQMQEERKQMKEETERMKDSDSDDQTDDSDDENQDDNQG